MEFFSEKCFVLKYKLDNRKIMKYLIFINIYNNDYNTKKVTSTKQKKTS